MAADEPDARHRHALAQVAQLAATHDGDRRQTRGEPRDGFLNGRGTLGALGLVHNRRERAVEVEEEPGRTLGQEAAYLLRDLRERPA